MSKQSNNPMRGIILSHYRSISEAARGIGMTRWRLTDIVDGAVSPTVDEVLDMTEACGVEVGDILAAVRHMRELHSSSQCAIEPDQPEDAAKKE